MGYRLLKRPARANPAINTVIEGDKERVVINSADGWPLSVSLFAARDAHGVKPVLIIFPALGAPAKAYTAMSAYLSRHGYTVMAVDPRSIGESGPPPSREIDHGVDECLYKDWPAIIQYARERYFDRPVVLIGHSIGGQISALYAGLRPDEINGLILLTAPNVHYRNWGLVGGVGTYIFFRLVRHFAQRRGYLPGHALFFKNPIARRLALDLAGWATTGRYRGSTGESLAPLFTTASCPVLAISFTDDRSLAPKRGVDNLCEQLCSAPITRWHLSPAELGLPSAGHFDHLRNGTQLWQRIMSWLDTFINHRDTEAE